jgi:hypothetical protein
MNTPDNTDSQIVNRTGSTAFSDASLGVKRLAILLAPTLSLLACAILDKEVLDKEGAIACIPLIWAGVRGIDWVIRGFLYEKK